MQTRFKVHSSTFNRLVSETAGKSLTPLQMDLSYIIQRIARIAEVVVDHPLIYFPMIGAWIITELYFIINSDEAHGHTYVMSTGITLIFTSYIISPFAIKTITWHLLELRTLLVSAMFFYGFFLVVFGIRKKFHSAIAEFFGDPGHSLIPCMMGILYIEHNIPFDRLTLYIVAAPVLFLSIVKIFRRLQNKLRRTHSEED